MQQRLLFLILLLTTLQVRANLLLEDIRHQFLPSEYQTVLVGEQDVPVFAAEPTTTISRGVAFIFMDAGYQGLTLDNATQLARQMNDWGWHTRIVPTMIEESLPLTQSDPNAPVDPLKLHPRAVVSSSMVDEQATRTQLALLVNAVYNDVESIPGFRLVIAQGMSATQLISLSSEALIPPSDSLVVISPYWPKQKQNNALAEQLANSMMPVLDLQLPQPNSWTADSPQERKTAVTKALKMHYRQKQLNTSVAVVTDAEQSAFTISLSKEIYGWVSYLGW